jgi:hypothetical protein
VSQHPLASLPANFLCSAHWQSGFGRPARRTEHDEKAMRWRRRLDFSYVVVRFPRADVFCSKCGTENPTIRNSADSVGLP